MGSRTVQILIDGKFVPAKFADIRRGQVFSLTEPDGTLVGNFKAEEDAVFVDGSTTPDGTIIPASGTVKTIGVGVYQNG